MLSKCMALYSPCLSMICLYEAIYAMGVEVKKGGVGRIMVLCVTHLYRPVLTLRTYHCHYKSGIPPLTCFFDQNPRNSFSTCPPNYSVIIS